MSGENIAASLANEIAAEGKYRDAVMRKTQRLNRNLRASTANTWTSPGEIEAPKDGTLIGRVSLETNDDEFLDGHRDFYIGTTHHEDEDMRVFSWAAPVACTYFQRPDNHHELCDRVGAIRVLAHHLGRIVDLEDSVFIDEEASVLFPTPKLQVPKAPRQETAPSNERAAKTPPIPETHTPKTNETLETTTTPPKQPTAATQRKPEPGTIRAPELLQRRLAAPKSIAMSSVLSTLQPDQYDAIVKPASVSSILQGHPGTGKTVIGAHRAAYLLNAWTPEDSKPRSHVLLLGPTIEYVRHVQGVLRELVDDSTRYIVRSIPSLLEELAGLPLSNIPTQSKSLQNVDLGLARLIDQALRNAKANLSGEPPTDEDVYAELRWFATEPPENGLDREWFHYLRELPDTIKELRKKGASHYRSLLAYIGVMTNRTPDPGHIIVDEAQDVHPIEWEILGRLGNMGGWTILGDLNQRRTDHTFGSWDDVAHILAIENEDDEAPVTVLENGYRSTEQIIKFANQLLPARERKIFSLQRDGNYPAVRRITSLNNLYSTSLVEAEELTVEAGSGSVAVITVFPSEFQKVLVKNGWVASAADPSRWEKATASLTLLPPERARGLEFDAVLVIEPADFPENFGRQGTLYTALTRANRILKVTHHRALPRMMKANPR